MPTRQWSPASQYYSSTVVNTCLPEASVIRGETNGLLGKTVKTRWKFQVSRRLHVGAGGSKWRWGPVLPVALGP